MRFPVSCVILTHNNQPQLAECINSVSWCEEIIVIDDFSTDSTAALAKKLGAQVYTKKLINFSSQRNFALAQAHQNWILFLDSDESVSPQLAREIQSVVTSKTTEVAYAFRRIDLWYGRWLSHGEIGQTRLTRLGRKNQGRWRGSVHEVWQFSGPIGQFRHPLIHKRQMTISQFILRLSRYARLRAEELNTAGDRHVLLKLLLYPKAKFFLGYVFRLGFLDGWQGLAMSLLMAFHSYAVRVNQLTLYDTKNLSA